MLSGILLMILGIHHPSTAFMLSPARPGEDHQSISIELFMHHRSADVTSSPKLRVLVK
ncbi:hypothetical protein PtB15_8B330 [Puccinia triticina]|nr:hypothetical protein PtB15_8B330 [Puccinia triticina]